MKTLNEKEASFFIFYLLANMRGEQISTTSLMFQADRANPNSREWAIEGAVIEAALSALAQKGWVVFVTRRSGDAAEKYYRITPMGRRAFLSARAERREEDSQRATGNAMIRAVNAKLCARQ